ncbi:hypothetical protein KFE98_05145 [bacterium SCSIO 12741]|nr:hypothetical protein KFE98_05145 [bacterium SCSIO 12741]
MNRKHWIALALLVATVLALLWPALYNGYPLVYSDSGTYINSGFKHVLPVDRPVTYSYLVRHISMEHSLWFVIIVQAVMVWFYSGYFLSTWFKRPYLLSSVLLIPLALLTGLSNFTSQIMADLLEGLALLGFVALVLKKEFKWYDYLVFLFTAYLFSTHMAFAALAIGLTLVVALLVVFRQLPLKSLLKSSTLAILPLVLLMFIQWSYSGHWRLSPAGNVFIFGRTLDSGIMQDYLKENCDEKGYFLCERVNDVPNHCHEMLWVLESPLYDSTCISNGGWSNCWKVRNDELGVIVGDLFTDERYRARLISYYGLEFFRQLGDFEIGHLNSEREGSSVVYAIENRINRELPAYQAARQYEAALTFDAVSTIQWIVVMLSLAALLFFSIRSWKTWPVYFRLALLLIILGILGNALIVDLFGTTVNRYMARIVWLLPYLALLMILFQPGIRKKWEDL